MAGSRSYGVVAVSTDLPSSYRDTGMKTKACETIASVITANTKRLRLQ
ncbi:hypothetical protein HT574_15425 [Parageobacillus sp. VR-IP]|nr:hypothetical protein [Parageobacillus sp. VR-IP]NUK31426.1 hypothetical protein [Parageobacillus sp. VR-IP]